MIKQNPIADVCGENTIFKIQILPKAQAMTEQSFSYLRGLNKFYPYFTFKTYSHGCRK